jgi:hypothetical protein
MARRKKRPSRAESKKELEGGNVIFADPKKLRAAQRIRRRRGYRLLIVLKPVLRKRLEKLNVQFRDNKDVVELGYKFKKHVLDKKPYDKQTDRFLTPKANFIEDLIYSQDEVENLVDDAVSATKDATGIVKQIVDGIVGFFKNMKKRKKDGKASDEDLKDIAEIESPENEKAAKDEMNEEGGIKKYFTLQNMAILLASILLGTIIYKKLSPSKKGE